MLKFFVRLIIQVATQECRQLLPPVVCVPKVYRILLYLNGAANAKNNSRACQQRLVLVDQI